MHALLLFLAVVSGDADSPASVPRWPAFLGANASPLQADTLPLQWGPDKNIAWTAQPPGYGQSSPVIWGDRVFVTSVEGPMKDRYHVLAYRLSDGEKLWQYTLDSSSPVESSNYVSRAAPTPVADADSLYVFFESGDLVALTHAGKQRWKRSLAEEYGKFDSGHGMAASPLLTEQAVVVLADHDGPAYLLAANKADGTNLWKTERKSRISWSSPTLIQLAESTQIVCSSNGSVDGYDPSTGKQLWSLDDLGGNTTASATPFGDGCFLVGASNGRGGEAAAGARRTNMAVRLETADGKPTAKPMWLAKEATSSFGSPIAYKGVAYWVNRSGVLYAYDVTDGKRLFTQRIGESCWATPVGVGERVYFFGKSGSTTVIKAGQQFEVLAENQLWDPKATKPTAAAAGTPAEDESQQPPAPFSASVQYAAAAVNGSLIIRSGNHMFCLRK